MEKNLLIWIFVDLKWHFFFLVFLFFWLLVCAVLRILYLRWHNKFKYTNTIICLQICTDIFYMSVCMFVYECWLQAEKKKTRREFILHLDELLCRYHHLLIDDHWGATWVEAKKIQTKNITKLLAREFLLNAKRKTFK